METLTLTQIAEQISNAGQELTFLWDNEFGFPTCVTTKEVHVEVKPYAQYKESIVIKFKGKGHRKYRAFRFLPYQTFYVFKGKEELNTKLGHTIVKTTEHLTVTTMGKNFDQKTLKRIKESSTLPLVAEYTGTLYR